MGELEKLEIRIESTTTQATNKIDSLIEKVGGLENAFTRIGNMNTTNLSNQLKVLGTSLQTFKQGNLTGRELTTIASGLQKVANVDASGLRNTANSMQQVASAMQSLNHANFDTSSLMGVVKSLNRLVPLSSSSASISLLGASIKTFVTDLNTVPALSFDATSLSNSINAISRLGGKNSRSATTTIPLLTRTLKNFIVEMNQIGDLDHSSDNLYSLANAIAVMGRKTSEKAITNIPQLTKVLKDMMNTLSKSPKVSENLINMTNALANLSATGIKATGTVNSLSRNYRIFGNHTKSLTKHTHGLASAFGMLYAKYWVFMRAFRMLGSTIKYASDLIEVQNVIDNTFGVSTTDAINKNAQAIEHLSKNTIAWFGMSELSTKQIAGRYMAMGTAMGLANRASDGLSEHLTSLMGDMGNATNKASELALNITALAGDMASFYNVDTVEMSEKLASGIYSGQARALRAYGLDLTIATLQEYALSKGINEKVKNMTQAEKTLLRYNYVMERTQNVQGDFMRTQGTWANQTRMLKQNLQQLGSVMGDVLIHAFKGIVIWTNKAILAMTSFSISVANALGKIFGWQVEQSGGSTDISNLVDDTESLSDGLTDATKKAKEFKNALQGFDKLNLITSPSNVGGAGGSGAGAKADSLGDWKIKKTENGLLKQYESDIVSLGDLGNMIQNKLADTLAGIDWKKIYLKAQNFGSGLANFLNGLLTPSAFSEVGKTFANSLNTVIYSGLNFVETFNWNQFGNSIATGLNKFFRNFDWASAGKTFGKGITGIFTSVNSFLGKTNWKRLGKAFNTFIKNAINEINWKSLAKIVTNGYKALMDFGGSVTGLGKGFTPVATSVGVLIGAFKGYQVIQRTRDSISKLADTIKATKIIGLTTKLGGSASGLSSVLGVLALTSIPFIITKLFSLKLETERATNAQKELEKAYGGKDNLDKFNNTIEDLNDKLETMKFRYDDIISEFESANKASQAETSYINDLIDSYDKLAQKTTLTADEKSKLKGISEKLVQYFPELQSYYNSESGLIDTTTQKLKDLNSEREKELKQKALNDMTVELYKTYYKSIDNLKDAYKALTDAEKALKNTEEEHSREMRILNDMNKGVISTTEEYGKTVRNALENSKLSKNEVEKLTKVLQALNKYGFSGENVEKYNELMKDLADGVIDNTNNLNVLAESADQYGNVIVDLQKKNATYNETQKKLVENVKKAKQAYDEQAKGIDVIVGKVKGYGKEMGLSTTQLKTANEYITDTYGRNAQSVFDSVGNAIQNVNNALYTTMGYSGQSVNMSMDVRNLNSLYQAKDNLQTLSWYNGKTVNTEFSQSIRSGSSSIWGILQGLQDIFSFNNRTLTIRTAITGITNAINAWRYNANGGIYANNTWKPITQYASGGIPDMGQMFIARESGPELVGSLGGHTAVMNNDQIVASVSNGVYQAVRSAMGSGQNVNVQVILQGDADGLFEVIQAKNQQYTSINGHSAF